MTGVLLVDAAIARDWTVWRNALSHLVLPAPILLDFSLGNISRMTRSPMLEQLRQEYMLTALVKGLSETRVIWRPVFRFGRPSSSLDALAGRQAPRAGGQRPAR